MEITTREVGNNNPLRILLDASFQEVKRLFAPAFNNITVLLMMIIILLTRLITKLKETVTENTFFQE